MAIISEIVKWAKENLKPWQRDALRRLFQKHDLDDNDIIDLYAMLRSAHGLPDPQKREPLPLSDEHVPAATSGAVPVILKAMRDLKNVNRIATDQRIEFGAGLTVVYGHNASGKSGYARVLKRACRARDKSEKVLPDAMDASGEAREAEAVFDLTIDGHDKSLQWRHNSIAPFELSSVAVFDSHCARAFLEEGEAVFLPYGLDILENLAQKVFPEIKRRLENEISSTDVDSTPFQDFPSGSAVSKILTNLNEKTDVEELRRLAIMSKAELTQMGELEAVIKENDPTKKAQELRLLEKRLTSLAGRITKAAELVEDTVVEQFKLLDEETQVAIQAEEAAAKLLSDAPGLLPGTGGGVWRSLFEAARHFSVQAAYPNFPFPYVGTEAKCPLCQQVLDVPAGERLRRFDEFVKNEAAGRADGGRKKLQNRIQEIKTASLALGYDNAVSDEIKGIDPAIHKMISDFGAGLTDRQKWILQASERHAWADLPKLPESPVESIKRRSAGTGSQARKYEDASDPAKVATARAQLSELQARSMLSQRITPLLKLVERKKIMAHLQACRDDLDTKAISHKAKGLASETLNGELSKALNREFGTLKMGTVKTKLRSRNERGRTLYKIVLDLPVANDINAILSEGEQRAIAIGSFLAEMNLTGGSSALVFDDPVSSLDHDRCKRVALRLVEEARKRQVIIFTHDTVFLAELLGAAEGCTPPAEVAYLEWAESHPGHVTAGLPWEHQSVNDRLDKLEKKQKCLAKNWPPYPNESERREIQEVYSLLRATIERAIEEVVFNRVINRYTDWIKCGRLAGVVGFSKSECETIEKLHKTCCDVTEAHDHASTKVATVPTPTELSDHINGLRSVIDTIKERQKKAKTDRHPVP